MDLWGAVISTGVVCTFYCTLVCSRHKQKHTHLKVGMTKETLFHCVVAGGPEGCCMDRCYSGECSYLTELLNLISVSSCQLD